MINAKSWLYLWNNDSQVPPHTVAGYATAATSGEVDIKRLVGVLWQAFDCKIGCAFLLHRYRIDESDYFLDSVSIL